LRLRNIEMSQRAALGANTVPASAKWCAMTAGGRGHLREWEAYL
jgi:hypothetical protein